MLLPQATKLNETRKLLAKQTHVAHVQQPLATNTNHDNLNDNTQQIQITTLSNTLHETVINEPQTQQGVRDKVNTKEME